MPIGIPTNVRVWDDDRGRWWDGLAIARDETNAAAPMIEVVIHDGDHPIHPWEAFTLLVPDDPELVQTRTNG
jgi:hypothetical protein